jgi:hypothetical protein
LTETLQLEEVRIICRELHDAPKLLVEWSPRWEEFVTSIGPAFARSGPRLAGEAPHGSFPYRGVTASLILQLSLLFAVMFLPREIDRLRPYAAPRLRPEEVIYYSGDELPRTEDLSGSQSGAAGRAGGREAHHRSQTIHVARGISLAEKVVDAPNLKLPSSSEAVANLLAFKSTPAPPSADGLHSSLIAPSLSTKIIAPAPANVAREYSRSALTFTAIVPPAPSISAGKSRTAPSLNSAVVPPAPNAPSEHALIAPRLDSSIIAPAPAVPRRDPFAMPSLNANVVAPAPTHVSDQARSAPALTAAVIPPAPATNGHEVPSTRVQMTNIAVVPPPVSAPERDSIQKAKLNLPAPSVVAPPPSADSAHDLRRLESGVAASSPTVVPPPPTQASSPSLVSNIIGKIFGTQDVVPPPPTVSSANRSAGGSLAAKVVPPPPNVSSSTRGSTDTLAAKIVPPAPSASGSLANGNSRMSSRAPNTAVVPPPPSMTAETRAAAAAGSGGTASSHRTSLSTNVVPPPPAVSGANSANSGTTRNVAANTLASNVVPPPPSAGAAISASGRKGPGFGSDAGSVLAPPKAAPGNSDNSGVVLSARPGSNVGMPGTGGKNSLAMSPAGGNTPGIGGSGAGTGIGRGEGSASGLTASKAAANSGAGKTGAGRGSDTTARNGISPDPGPGGAGSIPAGSPAVPGVDVRGGSTIVTLPSFGSDGGSAPNLPARSSIKPAQGPAITIVATSRSGGVFDFYGKLPGNNYAVYLDTAIGTVVMQFADANPGQSPDENLTGPEAIRTDLPANLPHARVVIKCQLDTSGNVRNIQVLEPGPATMTAKIVAALPGWKFRPAMRAAQPVEINAILGFNIDTNDRY